MKPSENGSYCDPRTDADPETIRAAARLSTTEVDKLKVATSTEGENSSEHPSGFVDDRQASYAEDRPDRPAVRKQREPSRN